MKAFFLATLIVLFLLPGCRTINQAASYSENDKVFRMVKEGQNVNERDRDGFTPLLWAARYSNYALVKFLVESGAELNHQESLWRYSALMYSVYYNNSPITEFLIERGADVNLREKTGYTALGLARRNGNEKLERLLMERGAKE